MAETKKINATVDLVKSGVEFKLNGGTILSDDGTSHYLHSQSNLYLYSGSSNTMTLSAAGNVGIGTTSPTKKLHVVGGSTYAALLDSDQDYTLGLSRSGTEEWWLKTYTDGRFAIHENGVGDKVTIKAGGNVGIGTTSPVGKFHSYISANRQIGHNAVGGDLGVISDNNSAPVLYVKGTGTADLVNIFDDTTEVFTILDGGNVGIGTTSPGAKLDVTTNHQAQTAIRVTHNNYNDYVLLKRRSDDTQKLGIKEENSNGSMGLFTADTTRVTITSAGNVGIGTTSPSTSLHVVKDASWEVARFEADSYPTATVYSQAAAKYAQLNIYDTRINSEPTMELRADTPHFNIRLDDTGNVLTIRDGGNVGIGTTSPGRQLELRGQGVVRLNGVSGGDPGIDFNTSDVNDMQIRYRSTTDALAIYSYGTSSDVLTIRKSDGNVGIGTTTISGQEGAANGTPKLQVLKTGTTGSYDLVARFGTNQDENNSGASVLINGGNDRGLLVSAGRADSNRAIAHLNLIQYDGNELTDGLTIYQPSTGSSGATSGTNIGIGTTSPSTKLQISGGNSSTPATALFSIQKNEEGYGLFSGVLGSGVSWMQSATKTQSTYYGLSLQPNGGNVGIGTTSPSQTFTVEKNSGIFRINTSTSTYPRIEIGSSSGTTAAIFNRTTASQNIIFGESSDTGNYIFRGGNVGIGTTSPGVKLHVNSGSVRAEGNATDQFFFEGVRTGVGTTIRIYDNANTAYIDSYNNMAFRANQNGGSGGSFRFTGGNVGIGTTSPTAHLHVENASGDANVTIASANEQQSRLYLTTTTNEGIYFEADDGSTTNFYIKEHSTGTARFTLNRTNGNVGIGTTSPGRTLSVETNDTATYSASVNASEISIARKNSSNTAGQVAAISLNATGWSGQTTGVVVLNAIARQGNFSNADFAIQNRVGGNFVETFRITTYGNVGIGTDTPDDNVNTGSYFKPDGGGRFLTVKDSAGSFIMLESSTTTDDDQIGGIYFNNTGGQADAHVHVAGIDAILHKHSTNDAFSGGDLRFFTKPSGSGINGPRMIILQNGSVGIGTTSPGSAFKLDVNGYIKANSRIYVRDSTKTLEFGTDYIQSYVTSGTAVNPIRFFTGSTEKARIDGNGNVGIGTTSPGAKLDVEGGALGNTSGDSTTAAIIRAGRQNIIFKDTKTADGTDWNNATFKIIAAIDSTSHQSIDFVNDGSYQEHIDLRVGNQAFSTRFASNGNVGIGTTSPNYKLHVDGVVASKRSSSTTALNGRFLVYWDNNNPTTDYLYGMDLGYNGTYRTRIFSPASYDISLSSAPDTSMGTQADYTDHVVVKGSTGNVGIGTTSPSEKLHVEGAIWAGTANSTSGSLLLVGKYSNGNITTIGTSYSSGGAVIGYGVKPSTTAAGAFLSSSGLANLERSAYVQHGSTHQWWTGAYQTVAVDSAATLSQSMTLDGSGNLGIGTTSPASKLHVQSGAGIFNVSNDWHQSTYRTHLFRGGGFNSSISEESTAVKIFNGSAVDGKSVGNYWGGIAFMHLDPEYSSWGTTYTGEHFWIGGRLIDTPGQERSALVFATNNVTTSGSHSSEKMVILPNGNVGIGTTSPSQKLDVNGDIAVKGASVINRATAALTIGDIAGTDSVTNLTLTTAGRNTEVFLDDSGNVGINTATPSYNLTVDSGTNDIGILTASSDSGSYVGFLDDSTSTIPKIGAVGNKLILDASQYVGIKRTDPSYALDVSGTIRATGDVIAYSDARVKENVETIPNALDKIKAMRGVGYNKIGEERRSIGVIAQEMLEVMPEAVHKDDSGMYSVAYGNLVGVLIEAMKEQQAQIDELKAKLDGSTK